MAENGLVKSLLGVIADLYVMYLRAHAAHWNVQGNLFPVCHAFYGDLYADVYGSIDTFGELVRQHGGVMPADWDNILKHTTVDDACTPSCSPSEIARDLAGLNNAVCAGLEQLFQFAELEHAWGLANFCQDRIQAHQKWDWMLRVQTQ